MCRFAGDLFIADFVHLDTVLVCPFVSLAYLSCC